MKPIRAHVNQIAETDNTLRFDEYEIRGKVSKDDKFFVAVTAVDTVSKDYKFYLAVTAVETIFDDDSEMDFREEFVPVASVIDTWMRPMNVAHAVDGMIAVQCADGEWRPLVFKTNLGYQAIFKK